MDAVIPTKCIHYNMENGSNNPQCIMDIACSNSAVVNTPDGDYILVIGGDIDSQDWIAAVELLHVRSKTCHELTKLPQALPQPSATICAMNYYT